MVPKLSSKSENKEMPRSIVHVCSLQADCVYISIIIILQIGFEDVGRGRLHSFLERIYCITNIYNLQILCDETDAF